MVNPQTRCGAHFGVGWKQRVTIRDFFEVFEEDVGFMTAPAVRCAEWWSAGVHFYSFDGIHDDWYLVAVMADERGGR